MLGEKEVIRSKQFGFIRFYDIPACIGELQVEPLYNGTRDDLTLWLVIKQQRKGKEIRKVFVGVT